MFKEKYLLYNENLNFYLANIYNLFITTKIFSAALIFWLFVNFFKEILIKF